ncbi:hypothetical protein D9619_001957 [Psilocybe cf. subviscida]|uniref:D-isomer specific 2-hydroxyacid dehydrogenase NAD-binding domain-containing protein n=1 Tax=Psilocybe cf. subviscida TaxID=2480587 RepID=A0A8H5BD65_9AGAR|nr:hypothetical protein D9619_001957 [Psilocybe cf. subviscida]
MKSITRTQTHKGGIDFGIESGLASSDLNMDTSLPSPAETWARIDQLENLEKNNLYDSLRDLRSYSFSSVPDGPQNQDSLFTWPSTDFVLRHGLGHRVPVPINERVLLSKLFSGSMRPSNVIPYFYRATGRFDKRDVTIATLITSNRLEVFARLVEKYRGPISVTLHIKDTPEHVSSILHALSALYTSSHVMRRTVDLHLVVDSFDRQFNTWRNIARLFARTDFVLMLDIDFFPCTASASASADGLGLSLQYAARKERLPGDGVVADKLYAGQAALVVPAFEYTDFGEGMDAQTFPTSKKDLLTLVAKDRIGMFHASWAPGHNASEYNRFYSASPGEVYKVTRYQSAYEPYVIFKKDGPPWCDDRFVGYGGNKAACLFEMYLAGISFYVHGDHFIIHQSHPYEERARKNERKINRKIYADFREEACLRYLELFHDEDLLHSPLAENALSECRKIKSLTRTSEMAAKRLAQQQSSGTIVWAHDDVQKLLGNIADIVYVDSPDRKSFLAGFGPGGKYENTVGIYRENESRHKIGIFDKELIDGLPSSVKWIAHNGAGYDPVDVHACKARGIYLSNTPGAVDDATATTALYLLISTLRQYSVSERALRALKWKPEGLNKLTHDVTGKTLAILGLGGIGTRLAVLAHAFPMRVIYHSRKKNPNAPEFCEYFEDVNEMLKQTDVLSVHVPLRAETVGLVDEKMIRALKPGAIIVNTARGKVIDEDAMIRALEDGHLAAAGLDVFPNEPEVNPRLLDFPQVTLLPHMGTENQDTQRQMEVRALQNLKDFLETGMGKDLVVEFKVKQKL